MKVLYKNTQKRYDLPGKVIYCTRCVISNQRPRITFNKEGVCSACQFAEYKKNEINWETRDKELVALAKRFKRKDGGYEVIVPASGGKDSDIVAHKLKYKYGMNVLTVTWSPHIYTEVGWKNFQNAIHVGGLDNILATPNGVIHRKLTKLSFEVLGDPFQPFIYGQYNFPLQAALKYKVPLIMYGENGEVEYGGDMKNAFRPNRDYKSDQKKHYFSNLAPEDLQKYGIDKKELLPYLAPPVEELDKLGVEIHFFSYYHKWIPQENYYYAVQNAGFVPNSVRTEGTYSKYASLDDKLDGFHYYLAYIKFGHGRTTSDAAHEVRDGHINREEAQILVKRFDGEFPEKHFNEFIEYCSIRKDYFWKVIDSWRSDHLWKKVNGQWRLRHTVNIDGTDD